MPGLFHTLPIRPLKPAVPVALASLARAKDNAYSAVAQALAKRDSDRAGLKDQRATRRRRPVVLQGAPGE